MFHHADAQLGARPDASPISALSLGTLHRVLGVSEVAGGKGVNVLRVLKALGMNISVEGF